MGIRAWEISRGISARGSVGDIRGELVVASPIYKQHFSLVTGRCLEEPSLAVPVYFVRVIGSEVWVRSDAVHREAWCQN